MALVPPTDAVRPLVALVAAGLALASGLIATPEPPESSGRDGPPTVRYGRDVRPLLSDRCFACHGADEAARAGGLRLDTREGALADRGGYAAVVPGDPDASELWYRVAHEDVELAMPPPEAKKPAFTDEERRLLRRWIEEGAAYEEHWAYVAPTRPPLPSVRDASWPLDDLDRFVLARLEAAGLAPSTDADRATLLRRVFLDLTGLPPTVDELDAFLADARPDAYEAWVDRLLEEEPYRSRVAEHLATPWLDAARYADTIGIHTDNGQQLWPYRDWVLRAFRDDLPYDRFVTAQLAGDLLPDATVDDRVATGFLRAHVLTDEGGAIDEEYLVEYAVDRTDTLGAVLLGSTTGCARCHDHKYDPLSQEEFYGLYAFFRSNDEPGLYSQTPEVAARAYEPSLAVPTPEQADALTDYEARLAELATELARPLPGEDSKRAAFAADLAARAGTAWSTPRFVTARSSDSDVRFRALDDGSVEVGGPVPEFEDQVHTFETGARDARLLLVEALVPEGHTGPGRTDHGNAVLSTLTLETRARGSKAAWREVPLAWAWADHVQPSGKFEAAGVLDDTKYGWALDSHGAAPARTLLVLADEPFGGPDGTELRVTLGFRSHYPRHSFGRVRVRVSPLADPSVLPVVAGRFRRAGPFVTRSRAAAYDGDHRPSDDAFLAAGYDDERWSFYEGPVEGEPFVFPETSFGSIYLARTLWSPDARELELSLGTDDGVRVFLDGVQVFENRVDRGVAADQDRVTVTLAPGPNVLVVESINTGGQTGTYQRKLDAEHVLADELPSLLLPADAVPANQRADAELAWRRRFFADWRALDDRRAALEAERDALDGRIPRTMVWRERAEPRASFVLDRGRYDRPLLDRPVRPSVPAHLSDWPEGAPANRLGLAAWLTSPEHPLFARVAVNRLWSQVFGEGLVRTPEDFGLQGAWPTHPALLDHLAVEFREGGWSVRELLRRLVCSRTYRQASTVRAELAARDPGNELFGRYPRRRLGAEVLRDLALHASGLLVERFGGPSVKPYQPAGLWKEVAMLQSNTRDFVRGAGDALWRRSLYTFWKRAVPPPALATLDAPTRESCVVGRTTTNTPLQALVLWNDEQFVEAARALAARTLERESIDLARLARLQRAATGRAPDDGELVLLLGALEGLRAEYAARPADAAALLAVGEAPLPAGVDAGELAAWTLVANALLNLHETLTQD